jgi:hypothetical protein
MRTPLDFYIRTEDGACPENLTRAGPAAEGSFRDCPAADQDIYTRAGLMT